VQNSIPPHNPKGYEGDATGVKGLPPSIVFFYSNKYHFLQKSLHSAIIRDKIFMIKSEQKGDAIIARLANFINGARFDRAIASDRYGGDLF